MKFLCKMRRNFSLKIVFLLLLTPIKAWNALEPEPHCSDEHEQLSEACVEAGLEFDDDDVDMTYVRPKDFKLADVVREIGDGSGYYLLKGMFSAKDVEIARDRVLFYENPYDHIRGGSEFRQNADNHNNYQGLLWGLLNKGRIFEKLVQHPVILEISRAMLGPLCQISSLAANTVLPGMMAQRPHLDYPYYDYLFPDDHLSMSSQALLSLQFVTLLTNFTKDNGGTAIRPYSHLNPAYPTDESEFFSHAVQIEGEAGDVVVFAGPIQHSAMANRSKMFRSAILQHMAPIYVKPFERIEVSEEVKARATEDMRRILALDHPYPTKKE